MIELVSRTDAGVTVTIDGHELHLPHRWIRDHSEDAESLRADTLQREVDTFALPRTFEAADAVVVGDELVVSWLDGSQASRCSAALLRTVAGLDSRIGPSLWAKRTPDRVARADCAEVMRDDHTLRGMLDQLVGDGVVMIDAMEPTPRAATALAERIGQVRHTVFGSMWRVATDVVEHLDSAYDTTYLEPHTSPPAQSPIAPPAPRSQSAPTPPPDSPTKPSTPPDSPHRSSPARSPTWPRRPTRSSRR